VIHRRHIQQWTEAEPFGALRDRGKKDAWRRREAKWRRVVLGDVIRAKTAAVVLLDQLEPALEQVGKGRAVVIKMIEDAELERHDPVLPNFIFYRDNLPHRRNPCQRATTEPPQPFARRCSTSWRA
jgi:hypothetical protein